MFCTKQGSLDMQIIDYMSTKFERNKAIHHACFPAQEHHDGKKQQFPSYMPMDKPIQNVKAAFASINSSQLCFMRPHILAQLMQTIKLFMVLMFWTKQVLIFMHRIHHAFFLAQKHHDGQAKFIRYMPSCQTIQNIHGLDVLDKASFPSHTQN